LAKALTEKGVLEEARQHLLLALSVMPTNAATRQQLADNLHRQGRVREAVEEYQTVLRLDPDWPEVLNNFAWLRATHSNGAVRSGTQAVALAEHACALTSRTNLWYLHTLAAAYAENGQFGEAITVAEQVKALAQGTGQSNLINTRPISACPLSGSSSAPRAFAQLSSIEPNASGDTPLVAL
jgi:Flp pilus assembly protein TadD